MPLMTKQKARQLNGLQLAYMGDTVCDLIARTQTMFSGKPVKEMHADATARVNARAQAEQMKTASVIGFLQAVNQRSADDAQLSGIFPHGRIRPHQQNRHLQVQADDIILPP